MPGCGRIGERVSGHGERLESSAITTAAGSLSTVGFMSSRKRASKGKRKTTSSSAPHRGSSRLSDHVLDRKARALQPPMLAPPINVQTAEWERDLLPDMLWIGSLVEEDWPDRGPHHAALSQLDQFVDDEHGPCLDGRLSSFLLMPEEYRAEARRMIVEAGALPDGLAHGLCLYPDCPAAWLLEDWRVENHVDPERGLIYLKGLVSRMRDGHGRWATQLRVVPLSRMAKNGKLHNASHLGVIDDLKRFPRDLEGDGLKRAESSIRAMYLALMQGISVEDAPRGWAEHFWRQNWHLSVCEQARPLVLTTEEQEDSAPDSEGVPRVTPRHARDGFVAAVEQFQKDLEALQERVEPNLYDPVSDEVRLGLAARQVRMLYRLVEDPNLWTDENAPHHLRSMVDARITTAWLLWKDDPDIYARYKAYGQGKLKLLKLNFADAVEQNGFSRSNEQALQRLEAAVNEDVMEEFQPIFVTPNFADRPIRKMAQDVGLKELYDLSYSPLSGESHGDWGSLISHDLRRCANPLHRYHRVASFRAQEQGLRLAYIYQAYNLMTETVEAVFAHYQLPTDEPLERCAVAFAHAVGVQGEPE